MSDNIKKIKIPGVHGCTASVSYEEHVKQVVKDLEDRGFTQEAIQMLCDDLVMPPEEVVEQK